MSTHRSFSLLALLVISLLNSVDCVSQEAEVSDSILWPFWTVEKSSIWVRPSLEEQKKTWSDNRFSPGDKKFYEAFFFDAPDGTNVPDYYKIHAGILDNHYTPRAPLDTVPFIKAWHMEEVHPDSIRGEGDISAFFGFFSLYHKIMEMRLEGNTITAVAEPQEKGHEQIVVAWPPTSKPVRLRIVDSEQKTLWEKEYKSLCSDARSQPESYYNFDASYPYYICVDRPSQKKSTDPVKNITGTTALREYDIPTSEVCPPGLVEAVEKGALKAYVLQDYVLTESRIGVQTKGLETQDDDSPIKPGQIAHWLTVESKSEWEQVVIFFYPFCYSNLPIVVDGIVYQF